MLGHPSGKVLLIASLVCLTGSDAVNGQIFVRHEEKQVGEPYCGLHECPPKLETFGFFRENWRRWPGESGITGDDLKPFVTPERTVPDSVVPDARDEASQVQRERTPIQSAPRGSDSGAGAMPEPGPSRPPSTDLDNNTGTLPDDLMNDTQPGGAFPSGDLPGDDLDEAFPSGDLPADDLQDEPGFSEEEDNLFEPDSDPLNDLPGLDESEIDLPGDDGVYDLDLGLKRPKLDHAQAAPRQGQLAAGTPPRQINLASAQSLADEVDVQIRTASARRNPLRRSLRARFATQRKPSARQQPRGQRRQSVAPASYSQPVPSTPARVKPGSRRANPLR